MTSSLSRRRASRQMVTIWALSALIVAGEASGRVPPITSKVPFVPPRKRTPTTTSLGLRGGSSTGGSGGGGGESSVGDIDDDELDEYIEFLLAAAEDKVTEDENPLFKRFRQLAEDGEDGEPVATQEESPTEPSVQVTTSVTPDPVLEEEPQVADEVNTAAQESLLDSQLDPTISLEVASAVEEEAEEMEIRPMVEDEEDERQLDEMIETLVNSVSDDVDEALQVEEEAQEMEIKPMIEDDEDEEQLDEMVETLVASVSDDEDEASTEEIVAVAAEQTPGSLDATNEEIEDTVKAEVRIEEEPSVVESSIEEAPPLLAEASLLDEGEVVDDVEASDEEASVMTEEALTGSVIPEEHSDVVGVAGQVEEEPTPLVEAEEMKTIHVTPSISALLETLDEQAVSETKIAKEAASGQDGVDGEDQNVKAGSPEFFLGPSAVEDTPQLVEDSVANTEGTAVQQMGDTPEPSIVDETPIQEQLQDTTYTTVSDTQLALSSPADISKGPSMLSSSMKLWGRLTSRLVGIESKMERSPTRTDHFASAWGTLTARALGIVGDGHVRAKNGSVDDFKSLSKRNIDLIYEKYYANYDPYLPQSETSQTAPVSEETIDGGATAPKSMSKISQLWGNIGKIINYERSKPLGSLFSKPVEGQDGSVPSSIQEENQDDVATDSPLEIQGATAPEEILDSKAAVTNAESDDDDVSPLAHDTLDSFDGSDDLSEEEETASGPKPVSETSPDELNGVPSRTNNIVEPVEEERADNAEGSPTSDDAGFDTSSPEPMPEIPAPDSDDFDKIPGEDTGAARVEITKDGITTAYSNLDDEYDQYDEYDQDEEPLAVAVESFDDDYDSDDVDVEQETVSGEEEELPASLSDAAATYHAAAAQAKSSVNFFYQFLILRGLEAWLMTIVLFLEWCRVYLAPIADDFRWLSMKIFKSEFRTQGLRETILARVRGGSDGNDTSDNEDNEGDISSKDGEDEGKERNSSKPQVDDNSDKGPVERVPRPRPNRLYRHLFSYGRLGHILIMECVLVNEWVDMYLPAVSAVFTWAIGQVFPGLNGPRDAADVPLSQTTGFVAADGSAVRGAKKKAAQTRKEDQKALSQLKRVGDVTQAKYRFLSQNFMKRHGIGPFAGENTSDELVPSIGPRRTSTTKPKHTTVDEFVEQESDNEWVLSALTQDAQVLDKEEQQAAVGNVPTVTVGIEIEGRKRSRRKRTSISDVTKITSRRESRKPTGPRISDRESGVMGRIRAAGANSLVGRSILGAYPGDVPPPSEAANAHGLFELAERYGYGEWSDDDEDENNNDDDEGTHRSAPKEGRRKKKRRRSNQHIGLEFEFGSGASATKSKDRVRTTPSRKTVGQGNASLHARAYSQKKGVAKAGRDAFEHRATKGSASSPKLSSRNNSRVDPISNTRKSGSNPAAKGSVLGAGLQHLKDKSNDKKKDK